MSSEDSVVGVDSEKEEQQPPTLNLEEEQEEVVVCDVPDKEDSGDVVVEPESQPDGEEGGADRSLLEEQLPTNVEEEEEKVKDGERDAPQEENDVERVPQPEGGESGMNKSFPEEPPPTNLDEEEKVKDGECDAPQEENDGDEVEPVPQPEVGGENGTNKSLPEEPPPTNLDEEGEEQTSEDGAHDTPQMQQSDGEVVESEAGIPQEGLKPESESIVKDEQEQLDKDGDEIKEEESDDDSFATAEGTDGEREEEEEDERKSSDEEGSRRPLRRRRRGGDSELSEEEEGEGEEELDEREEERGETEEREEERGETEEREENGSEADGDQSEEVKQDGEDVEWTEKEEPEKVREEEEEEEEDSNIPHVPTVGIFFQHDTRLGDADVNQEVKSPIAIQTRADKVERWGHDLYVEEEQVPRKDWEKERDASYWADRDGDNRTRSKRGQRLGNFMKDRDRERFDFPRGRGGRGRRGRGGGRGGYRDRYRDDYNEAEEGRDDSYSRDNDARDGGDGYVHRDEERSGRGRGRGRRGGGGGYGRYRNNDDGREGGGWQENGDGEERLAEGGGERQDNRRYQDRDDRRYQRDSNQHFAERRPRERGKQSGDWDEDAGKSDTPPRERDQYDGGSRRRGNRGQRRGGRGWEDRADSKRRDNFNNTRAGEGGWDSQVPSETGTEDWGQDSAEKQSNDGNWSTVAEAEDKVQSPPQIDAAQEDGGQTSTTSPAQGTRVTPSSGGGEEGGERIETTIFSLSRDKDLVMRYTSKRGKVRGRGQRSSGSSRVGGLGGSSSGGKTRYAPPKPGSGGITVIEPLEKRLQRQDDDEREWKDGADTAKSDEGSPSGARLVRTAESAKERNRPGSGHSPSNKDGSGGASKPKRYSSQRQKGEGDQQSHPHQPLPQQLPPPHHLPEPPIGQWAGLMGPGAPGGPIPNMPPLPVDPAAYQELLAQQNKWMEMTAASGVDLMALQAVMFQNPMLLQQQQIMWQQPFSLPPGSSAEGPPLPPAAVPPPPPGDGSLLGYPPQLPGMPLPGGLEQKPHYTSPSGLFIPSIPPDQQRRQHTKQQKPRSQAIPIISPTVVPHTDATTTGGVDVTNDGN